MTFRPQEFRAVIVNDQPKIFNIFLKKLITEFKGNEESVFVIRVIAEIGGILKDQSQSPIIKFKTIKIIMHLLIMGETQIYEVFEGQIYPILRNACLYNRAQPLASRGTDFFKNNKYNSIANPQEKTKIRVIGCKFIAFCLECVYTLASWLKKDPKNKAKQSNFSINYKMLLKQNVTFPQIHEFTFFTEERITQIQNDLKKTQSQIDHMSKNIDSSYFLSLKSQNDTKMMNGVEYLQHRLKSKDKQIQELKQNYSSNDFNKEQIIHRQRDQQNNYINKIAAYEQKMNELTGQVREFKALLQKYDTKEMQKREKRIEELQRKVQKLSAQNKQLKEQLQNRPNASYVSNSTVKAYDVNKQPYKNHVDKKNQQYKILLELQNQPKEFLSTKNSPQKEVFYQYKEIKDCLYPYYDSLSKEQQNRFKKCLLKSKQILHKTKQLQVGTYSVLNNLIQIDLTIIITNLNDKNMYIVQNTLDHPKETQIIRQPSIMKKKLKPNEQYKETMRVIINDIDSRCIVMVTQFHYQASTIEKLALILPITKIKLMRPLNYTSHSVKNWISMERLITMEKRILNSIEKIKEYFPKCFVQNHKTVNEYHLKFQFLQKIFFISFNLIGQQTLRLNLTFNDEDRCLSQKIMAEFMFILSK